MRLIDLYYKKFKDYRESIQNNPEGKKFRQAIKRANKKDDSITITKYTCQIKDDWIKNIEDGLIYIEKAINEQRQFIRTEGEVVRIEKVKKTSKHTVEHLSRHSNLITRIPKKGQTIIPDKLYIVEKLSDYAVYENRFLLLLLTYLRDFVYVRLEKIKTKTTTYQSEMHVNKHIDIHKRHIDYQLGFSDKYLNDPYLLEEYYANPLMKRMEEIYYSVDGFLQSPLMKEVAKSPMLTPPIVKTNVLRMNPNFRETLKLYDYIMAYNEPGYDLLENKKTYNPFQDDMANEITETIELTTFISYKFGNEITEDLKKVYNQEEKKRAQELLDKKKEELRKLKKRLKEKQISLEEYILKLEKRNIELEKENSEMNLIKKQNKEYKNTISKLEEEKEALQTKIDELNKKINIHLKEIQDLKDKYFKDMAEAKRLHRQEMDALTKKFEEKISAIIEKHKDEINELNNHYTHQINELKKEHQQLINTLKKEHEEMLTQLKENHAIELNRLKENHAMELTQLKEKHDNDISMLNNEHQIEKDKIIEESERIQNHLNEKIDILNQDKEDILESKKQLIIDHNTELTNTKTSYDKRIKKLKSEIKKINESKEKLSEKHKQSIAKINKMHDEEVSLLNDEMNQLSIEKDGIKGEFYAFKQKHGLVSDKDDFTSKDRFKELEEMKKAFNKFFKEQWKETKAKIRARVKEKSEEILEEEIKSKDK